MPTSVTKCLGNGTSDGNNHTSQVSIRIVSCFINEYTFFEYISTHSDLYSETNVISKQHEENQFAC